MGYGIIVTDGMCSMEGDGADLATICDPAEGHDAPVMVDDSHATGVIGRTGRGGPECCRVADRVDVITSTLGEALGRCGRRFTARPREIIAMRRQQSRP